VGPAGRVLDEALEAAGIDRIDVYITNVVKHFKHLVKGWRRWHRKPSKRDIDACRAWIEKEIEVVQPQVLVCLGATSAQALLGPSVRVTVDHGRDLPTPLAPHAIVTLHPSAILRQPTSEDRHRALQELTADLKTAAKLV
jgi:DNA polymerase